MSARVVVRSSMRSLGLCFVLGTACATPRRAIQAGPAAPAQLSEGQALSAVQEALVEAGALAARGLPMHLRGRPFEADVHFAEPPFAIEWLSAEDRRALGAQLPGGTPNGPLQIVQGELEQATVQVLVLDAAAYVYESNPLLVQRGAAGIEDAEHRVRHDVADFVAYVRDQGGVL